MGRVQGTCNKSRGCKVLQRAFYSIPFQFRPRYVAIVVHHAAPKKIIQMNFKQLLKMSVTDIQDDSDMDLIVTVRPYFNDNDKRRIAVDDVVAGAAGYIAWDRSALKNPAILHKDHDRLNYRRDNLQWVEQDSQEYQDYLAEEKQQIRNKNITMNPTIQLPYYMQP